jgi:transcriptional regulator with XRE-family HTH domain
MTGAKRARVRARRLPASSRGFGRRLRLARVALGLTEHQAAAAAAVTLQTFRRWEGRRWPHQHWGAVAAFAAAYDVNLDWLLLGGDPGGLGSHLSKRTAGKVVLFCPRGKAWSGPFSPGALRVLAAADARSEEGDDPRPSA